MQTPRDEKTRTPLALRAEEVEAAQLQAEASKEASTLAAMDARAGAAMARATSVPAVKPAAKPRKPPPPAKPASDPTVTESPAHVAGLEAAWQAAGWPEGSAAAYYAHLQANGFQIPYPQQSASPPGKRSGGVRAGGFNRGGRS